MRKFICILMALLAIAGLVSSYVRFLEGMKVTNLTSSIPWGMWVVFYIYFVGLSAGSYLISTLPYVFGFRRLERIGPLAILCAILALVTGLVFIWMDLGHPFRFWKVITNFNYTSILAWEVILYSLYLALLLVSFWFLKRCELVSQAKYSTGMKRVLAKFLSFSFSCPQTQEQYQDCHLFSLNLVKYLGFIGIPLVLFVRGGTGALFAVVASRPHWFSGLLPVMFLVSGLLSATAMLLFIHHFFSTEKERQENLPMVLILRNLLLLFLSIETFLFASETLVGIYSKIPERLELYHLVMFGPFPYIFWGGQLFLGLIIPVFLCSYKKTRRTSFWLSIAGLSCSCGVVSIILNLVIPAYVLPMLKGLDRAFIDHRLIYFYFPSIIEWLSSFGLISLVVLVFIYLVENLPVFSRTEIKF
ncbi:MAG: polysulfide reductase NrfD [Candidatus Omnitrophica bacterium]|nr:polysulfide reductase NrfD [Candidatus Omnitrophota bacterium]